MREFLRDPRALEDDNYARYPADDELCGITSNAELDAWVARKRAETPRKPFSVRLLEIAASEPGWDGDAEWMRNPLTGWEGKYSNTEDGLAIEITIKLSRDEAVTGTMLVSDLPPTPADLIVPGQVGE
jgi:hypothetical protein